MAVKKIALVTGGGSGLGEAISLRLAREGMAVGVLDVNTASAASVAKAINDGGGKAIALTANVADRKQIDAAVAEVHKAFGPITVLVNNAGIEYFGPFTEISEEDWDKVLGVNLKGMLLVTQSVVADMTTAGWGRIVTITALGAQMSVPNILPYTTSKGGVISFTKSLAAELGPKGITVNTISPGVIDTPMTRRSFGGNGISVTMEQMCAVFPIPRPGKPEDVAAACAFLVSEDACFITSQVLGVNGGAG
jgi:NAD(P)-dependent dehydrogenase (short-subunit alcohol dehydrogenase family)